MVCKTEQHLGIGDEANYVLGLPYMALRAMKALVVQDDI
jgi:hypothetical protein